ncbi:hypothetical protein [Clostridium cellulovorans]|nr:hypothetical protein [Clostridium cellulovorans]
MFLKKNKSFLFIILVITILINVFLYYICLDIGLESIEFVLYCIVGNGSIILCATWLIIGKYYKWIYDTIKHDIINDNNHNIISKYKIKKPFKKEIDIGYITADTAYISNILNIMEVGSIIILMLLMVISYNIDTHMNITAVIIGSVITFLIYAFHFMLEEYNHLCVDVCELLLNVKSDIMITDSLDDTIKRNNSKLRGTIYVTIIILILNLLSVIYKIKL